jgi:hypothetical protein
MTLEPCAPSLNGFPAKAGIHPSAAPKLNRGSRLSPGHQAEGSGQER